MGRYASRATAEIGAGATVALVDDQRPGSASRAAAGLLAPSIGSLPPAVAEFFVASLAAYPAYLARLQSIDPGLQLLTGLIEVGGDSTDGKNDKARKKGDGDGDREAA